MENVFTRESRSSYAVGLDELERSIERLARRVSRANALRGDERLTDNPSPHADNPQIKMADNRLQNQAASDVAAVLDDGNEVVSVGRPVTYKTGRRLITRSVTNGVSSVGRWRNATAKRVTRTSNKKRTEVVGDEKKILNRLFNK